MRAKLSPAPARLNSEGLGAADSERRLLRRRRRLRRRFRDAASSGGSSEEATRDAELGRRERVRERERGGSPPSAFAAAGSSGLRFSLRPARPLGLGG